MSSTLIGEPLITTAADSSQGLIVDARRTSSRVSFSAEGYGRASLLVWDRPVWDMAFAAPGTSSGMEEGVQVTRPSLGSNLRMLSKAFADVAELPPGPQRGMAMRIVECIKERMAQREDYRRYLAFPSLYVRVLDGGEVLVEWPFQRGRVHFSIEREPDESDVMFLDGTGEGTLPMVVSKSLTRRTVDPLSYIAVDFVAGRI